MLDDRSHGYDEHDLARPGSVVQILAFAAYAEERASDIAAAD